MTSENERCLDHLPAGWATLYLSLLADVAASGCEVEITEVKEKFGSLRVHCEQADAAARSLIAQAEERSKTVCQICGADGEILVRNHHYITLCPIHGGLFQAEAKADRDAQPARWVD